MNTLQKWVMKTLADHGYILAGSTVTEQYNVLDSICSYIDTINMDDSNRNYLYTPEEWLKDTLANCSEDEIAELIYTYN